MKSLKESHSIKDINHKNQQAVDEKIKNNLKNKLLLKNGKIDASEIAKETKKVIKDTIKSIKVSFSEKIKNVIEEEGFKQKQNQSRHKYTNKKINSSAFNKNKQNNLVGKVVSNTNLKNLANKTSVIQLQKEISVTENIKNIGQTNLTQGFKSSQMSSVPNQMTKVQATDSVVKNLNTAETSKLNTYLKVKPAKLISRVTKTLLALSTKNDTKTATIKITDTKLGKLELVLEKKHSDTKAILYVHNESAKSEMEKVLPEIQQNLVAKGLELSAFEVRMNFQDPGQLNHAKKRPGQEDENRNDEHDEDEYNEEETVEIIRDFGYNTLEVLA
jgi:hypothetical protein